MKLAAMCLVLCLFHAAAFAAGRPTYESKRLANGVPDFHQYEAEIVRIVDADTLTVKMHLLPGLEYTLNVRSRGVDAPELKRHQCDWEETIAIEAKEAIERRFPIGSWVYIENIEEGSFAGRIIADIKQRYGNQRWRTVTDVLLEKEGRWGVHYQRGKQFNWCRILPSE